MLFIGDRAIKEVAYRVCVWKSKFRCEIRLLSTGYTIQGLNRQKLVPNGTCIVSIIVHINSLMRDEFDDICPLPPWLFRYFYSIPFCSHFSRVCHQHFSSEWIVKWNICLLAPFLAIWCLLFAIGLLSLSWLGFFSQHHYHFTGNVMIFHTFQLSSASLSVYALLCCCVAMLLLCSVLLSCVFS